MKEKEKQKNEILTHTGSNKPHKGHLDRRLRRHKPMIISTLSRYRSTLETYSTAESIRPRGCTGRRWRRRSGRTCTSRDAASTTITTMSLESFDSSRIRHISRFSISTPSMLLPNKVSHIRTSNPAHVPNNIHQYRPCSVGHKSYFHSPVHMFHRSSTQLLVLIGVR